MQILSLRKIHTQRNTTVLEITEEFRYYDRLTFPKGVHSFKVLPVSVECRFLLRKSEFCAPLRAAAEGPTIIAIYENSSSRNETLAQF